MKRTLWLVVLVALVLAACRQEPEPPPPPQTNTVVDVLIEEGFTTLAVAIQAAGLLETFNGGEALTLLAPTNEALEALPEGALAALLTDPETLAGVLEYHLLNPLDGEAITVQNFKDAGPSFWLTTDNYLAVTLEGEGDAAEVVLNGVATITKPDLRADNGIIQGIDTVLSIPKTEFSATLAGANEEPPVESSATGKVTATLEGATLTVSGSYEGLTVVETPGAHIHGPATTEENADILFPLTFDNDAGTLSATVDLTAPENAAFGPATFGYLQSGLLYANLHTEANPSGEIRGQLLPSEEEPVEDADFTAKLNGGEEVPAVTTDATGTAAATFDAAGTTLTVTGTYTGLSSPLQPIGGSAGHIHEAPRGENGAVIVPLTLTPDETDPTSGTISVTAPTGAGEGQLSLETLVAGGYYINIHTEDNPNGEIRGQLTPVPTSAPAPQANR